MARDLEKELQKALQQINALQKQVQKLTKAISFSKVSKAKVKMYGSSTNSSTIHDKGYQERIRIHKINEVRRANLKKANYIKNLSAKQLHYFITHTKNPDKLRKWIAASYIRYYNKLKHPEIGKKLKKNLYLKTKGGKYKFNDFTGQVNNYLRNISNPTLKEIPEGFAPAEWDALAQGSQYGYINAKTEQVISPPESFDNRVLELQNAINELESAKAELADDDVRHKDYADAIANIKLELGKWL